MKSSTQQLALAEKHLGEGGSKFRKFCGMSSGPYCNAFVCYVFNEAGNASLFYGGKKVTYCPTSIKWCYNNLACIPIYLALPSDVIFFDWEPNGYPNHIGFVRERKSDQEVYTIEGNTSKTDSKGRVVATGVVAYKTRQLYGKKNGKTVKYIQGVFRPHFTPSAFSANKKLVVDGYFGYNSIAVMQKWLGVKADAILKRSDIIALQKRLGVSADADWGPRTSKALQKLIGTDADGAFGPKSVKAFQSYLNKTVFKSAPSTTKTLGDKIADTAKSYVGKVKYVKGGTNLKTGVDCTGFVQAIYGLNGIKLQNKLSDWGKSIGTDVNKALPGDIFTYKNGTGIHHGIYVGGGKVVHAANPKEGVKISNWNSMSRPLVGIRRRWK